MCFHTIQKKGSSVVAFCEFRPGCRLSCSTSLCVGTTVELTQMPQLLSGFASPRRLSAPTLPTRRDRIFAYRDYRVVARWRAAGRGLAEGVPPAPASLALVKATDPKHKTAKRGALVAESVPSHACPRQLQDNMAVDTDASTSASTEADKSCF